MSNTVKAGLLSILTTMAPLTAVAQDFEDYGDEASDMEKPKKRAVREIVKGMYAKTNVGLGIYLGTYKDTLQPGTSMALAFGQDFYDQENMSMAWELTFFQGINNGVDYNTQANLQCYETGSCIQGDIRVYTIAGLYEISFYPTRRLGIGLRAGGGMAFTPLLMDEGEYEKTVVGTAGGDQSGEEADWEGNRPTVHDQAHPVVIGGPTIEYYTKLSHFSVGIDVDVSYAVGFDLGLSTTGTVKYTF